MSFEMCPRCGNMGWNQCHCKKFYVQYANDDYGDPGDEHVVWADDPEAAAEVFIEQQDSSDCDYPVASRNDSVTVEVWGEGHERQRF